MINSLNKYAHEWRGIGLALNFDYSELMKISHNSPQASPHELLEKLLSEWSLWPNVDHIVVPRLEGLCHALCQMGLVAVAENLYEHKHLLPSQHMAQTVPHMGNIPMEDTQAWPEIEVSYEVAQGSVAQAPSHGGTQWAGAPALNKIQSGNNDGNGIMI